MKVRYIKADGTEQVRNNAKCPNYEQLTSFVGGSLEWFSMLVKASDGKQTTAVK